MQELFNDLACFIYSSEPIILIIMHMHESDVVVERR